MICGRGDDAGRDLSMAKRQSKTLNPRQQAFVTAYLREFNGSKAARAAGYSTKAAHVQGCRLLKNANIANAILARMNTEGMTPDRVKLGLAEIAFGADLADYWDDLLAGKTLKEIRAAGANTKLIKSISETPGKYGTSRRVEVYSQLDALEKIARVLNMLGGADKVEAEPPTVNAEIEAQVLALLGQSTKIHPHLEPLPVLPGEDVADVEPIAAETRDPD